MEYKHPYFTEEEVEEDKKDILRLREKGVPYRRIKQELGRSISYIKTIEAILIEEGKITGEEIELATERYFKENPVAQGINKTKVSKKGDTTKADIRHQKSLDKKEEIYQLLKQGYSQAEISHELKIIDAVVHHFVNKLISEGKIQEDEIKKGKSGGAEVIDRSSEEYLKTRNEIVELLKSGEKNSTIGQKLNLTPYDINIYVSDIKRYKILSSEQIVEARELKKLQELQFVAEYIKRGYTLTQIREMKPEFSYNKPTALAKILVELGIITKEEIDKNRDNGKRDTMNRGFKLSQEEQRTLIIKGIKKGLTPLEIVESDKTGSLSMHKVLYQKRLIIQEGIITKEKADKAMQNHINKELDKKHQKYIKQIKKYVEQGYFYYEIADMMHISQDTIVKLKQKYTKQNGWYSKEELKKFQQERILREKIEKEQKEKAEMKQKRKEEIEISIQDRKEQKRLEKIVNKLETARKLAKKEDKKEIDGEIGVAIVDREKYLEVLIEADSLEYKPKKEDIELVLNTITLYPNMANKRILKLLITNTMRLFGVNETKKLINGMARDLAETPYRDGLISYRSWIKGIEILPTIERLKEQGLSNEQIAQRIGISTYEIKKIIANAVPDFDDGVPR